MADNINNKSPIMPFPLYVTYATSNKLTHAFTCYRAIHINSLRTNRHNKTLQAIANTLLSNPTSCHYTLINANTHNNQPPQNTLSSWLLPCYYFLPCCQCLAHLRSNILCIQSKSPFNNPPFSPSPRLTVQFMEYSAMTNSRTLPLLENIKSTTSCFPIFVN